MQSLRYLAIDYPTCRSFQVANLHRIVMGTEILDLQILDLNMRNEIKTRVHLRKHITILQATQVLLNK